MRYLSTFTGIGGFEIGIHRVFGETAECIGYSEIDKPAIKTYEEHYEHYNYGDITAIEPAGLPTFDLIVGGFPCQAFSVAGKRRGFDEARGTLFFDVARILEHKRPGHLVLENVAGLLNHDKGKTFEVILGILTDLGYDIEWQLFNSKRHGVPQNRQRIYIVGHLRDRCGRKVFPVFGADGEAVETECHDPQGQKNFIKIRNLGRNGDLRSDISPTIQASEVPGYIEPKVRQIGEIWGGQSGRVYSKDGLSPTLPTMSTGGRQEPKVMLKSATKSGYETATPYDGINLGAANSTTRRGRVQSQAAQTLNTSGDVGTFDGYRIRRLTPIECERLQGFPDNWTIGSDTQRYKQCGNAVTTNVVEAVITALKPCLTNERE